MSLEPSADGHVPNADHVASPAMSPVYVLVGPDGGIVASTEVFNRLVGGAVISAAAVGSAVASITKGNQELVGLSIDGPAGRRIDIRVEAVLNRREQRLALIELQMPRPADGLDAAIAWFATFAANSPAVVWLKDLDGRYAYVNRQYTAELGAQPETVLGQTDVDLSQLDAIDGPRSRAGIRNSVTLGEQMAEPLSLEYTIPSFDRRPAYAALRFPLLDPAGQPLIVCGVASPADHSEVAQRECEHLLTAARWYAGDVEQLRNAALHAWDIRAVRPQGSLELDLEDEAASAAELAESAERAAAAEHARSALEDRITELQHQVSNEHSRASDLEGSLSDARGRANALAASLEVANTRAGTVDAAYARISELESMVATASSAGIAAAQSAGRVMELELTLRTMRGTLEQERAQRLAGEEQHQEELAAARDAFDTQRAAQERHESELSAAQDRVRMELNAANQRHQAEISHLREQHAALVAEQRGLAEREVDTARHELGAQMTALTEQLTQAHAHIDVLEAGLLASRDQITRLERAAAAATAAVAGPIPSPMELTNPAIPARPARSFGSETALAPAAQLGWDSAAQQALVSALGGCLNLRSILSESVRLIGTGGGWDVVVAWLPNENEGKFSCSATWVRSPVDMARLETSMWQARQSATASTLGVAAASADIVWITNPGADGDRHLAAVKAEGVNTVVLLPVRHQGQVFAVLELGTHGCAQASAQADAALRSIEGEVSAANQRLVDSASASQWGRRRR